MDANEIYERLMDLRQRLIADGEEPLGQMQNSMLWDVAVALGLDATQADELAGDSVQATAQPEPKPQSAMQTAYDFSESGFGIGRLGADTDSASEVLAEIEAADIMRRAYADQPQRKLVKCDCGHYSAWPMSASLGTTCPDCYDKWSN